MLQNLEFWLKTRAFWQKVGNFQGFLVKNLQISKAFTPQTGNSTAARLLLRFYVTIFGISKQNRPKKKRFSSQKASNLQGFYTPNWK
jgi:hypothetical protein